MTSAASSSPFVFSPVVASASGGGQAPSVDAWVHETRREISEIVREVALAARTPQPRPRFLQFLADRLLRAMAAEGVVIWQRLSQPAPAWAPMVRLGRVTDQTFEPVASSVHQHLLVEVAREGRPVVIPPTPGTADPGTPTNPADVPVAIVPVEVHGTEVGAEYLLEVFLEPEGGVATQRGYLRFVVQLADLAGEFLRADEIQQLHRHRAIDVQLNGVIERLHAGESIEEIAAHLVDGIADVHSFDRVGLCAVQHERIDLIGVSYVTSIAQGAPAAEQIRHAARAGDSAARADDAGPSSDDGSSERLHVIAVVASPPELPTGGALPPELPPGGALRLVVLSRDPEATIDDAVRASCTRCLQHAALAMRVVARLNAIPGMRRLSLLLAPPRLTSKRRRVRRWLLAGGLVTAGCLVALFPVPLTVVASGTLRAQQIDHHCAARSSIVQTVHVDHGQSVVAGEPLMTLYDDDLEQQITSLLGRRAVLAEQQARWIEAIVDTASHRLDRTGQLHNERDLVEEELRSIDQQLVLLREIRDSLVVRAEHDGLVDAWQLRQRLSGRPLQRGDYLLSVIEHQTEWVVDAEVAQNRVAQLDRAKRDDSLEIRVALTTHEASEWPASLATIGPALPGSDSIAKNAVLVALDPAIAHALDAETGEGPINGAPARVVCHCGTAPLVYALLQDAITSIRQGFRLYVRSAPPTAQEA